MHVASVFRGITGVALSLAMVAAVQAQYSGGSGTAEDPYQIATAADLIALGETPDDYDKHFILTADIDLDPNLPGGKVFDRAVIAPAHPLPWEGYVLTPFVGVFDGFDHTISHLTISYGVYSGLFGRLGSEGKICRLGLEVVNIMSGGDVVGAVVALNEGSISNCHSTGTLGTHEGWGGTVGGLVGRNAGGSITDCYSVATVTGWDNIGSLAGQSEMGSIVDCHSTGTVEGVRYVGGLVGRNEEGAIISNCYCTAAIAGTDRSVGGLVGYNAGDITVSEASGTVRGEEYDVGGLAGTNAGSITVSNSSADVWGDKYVGGLIGDNYGSISNCYSRGTASGSIFVGGLAGANRGDITASYSVGTVTGDYSVGGLVGANWGDITASHNTGSVRGDESIGGLVGDTGPGDITASHNTGMVIGNECVGGLVGTYYGYGGIENGFILASYNTGAVSGGKAVGGLVGGSEAVDIVNCYNAGEVTGTEDVGGLLGHGEWPYVATSYSTGKVSGETRTGGLVGNYTLNCTIVSSFWDIESSGQAESAGGESKTTTQMHTAATFLEAGWDFVGETENGTEDIWEIVEGQTYPLLSWQKYGGGTGEPNDPYLIYTAEHLNTLGAEPNDYDKHFKLMADIDLSGYAYDRAVIAAESADTGDWRFEGMQFTGAFNGNSYTVSHLSIIGESYLGLFGQLSGTISNLRVTDVNIIGSGTAIGSVVGRNGGLLFDRGAYAGHNDSYVVNCHGSGSVSGNTQVGGLVGTNSSSISQCSFAGRVNGFEQVGGMIGLSFGVVLSGFSNSQVAGSFHIGGLLGENGFTTAYRGYVSYHTGSVIGCYSLGSVSGEEGVGGLVGKNRGAWYGYGDGYSFGLIRSCYSASTVTGITNVAGLTPQADTDVINCFWDMETSGQSVSAGGIGLTTAEMQTATTFLEAGWDFIDETDNGTEDIWWILEGQDYPRLWWELPLDEHLEE